MSGKLKETIANQIGQKIREHVTNGRGKIISHDLGTNSAKISYDHPIHGLTILEKVPLRMNPGMHSSRLRPGTDVYLEFVGGNMSQALIVATADDSYSSRTMSRQRHERKGAFVPDMLSERSEF